VINLSGPIGKILGFIAIFFLIFSWYKWVNIDNQVIEVLKSKNQASTFEILDSLGYSKSEMIDCKFITCRVYEDLNQLLEDGEIKLLDTSDSSAINLNTVFILSKE
jgi:hypothetical protein